MRHFLLLFPLYAILYTFFLSPASAFLPNDSACSNSGQCCSNFCWISRCAAPAPSPTTSPCAVFNQSCFNLPCCSSSPPLFCDFGSGTVCHYTSASPCPPPHPPPHRHNL